MYVTRENRIKLLPSHYLRLHRNLFCWIVSNSSQPDLTLSHGVDSLYSEVKATDLRKTYIKFIHCLERGKARITTFHGLALLFSFL